MSNLDFTCNKENADKILNNLERFGLCVLPDFLTKDQLTQLNAEFDQILATGDTSYATAKPYSNGKCVILRNDLMNSSQLPTAHTVFNSSFMRELTDLYLGNEAYLNREIFVVNDVVGTKHFANDLHFDIKPTLKFFIYLTDTTAENGAFSCVPGSHKHTQELRRTDSTNISYDNREYSRDLPAEETDIVPIEGNAGSLIIFTTDVFHRAGIVSKGERRVMRGHCRLTKDAQSGHKRGLMHKIKRKFAKLLG